MSNRINFPRLLSFFLDNLISEITFSQKEKITMPSNINHILKGKMLLKILSYRSTLTSNIILYIIFNE